MNRLTALLHYLEWIALGVAAVAICFVVLPMKLSDTNLSPPQAITAADPFAIARNAMVERQLKHRDITNARVLEAMRRVERHRFVDKSQQAEAYDDHPLPIGYGQTISQPYVVALMAQLVDAKPNARALEIGFGCGYQTAVLAELCREVYGVEILPPLADAAKDRLEDLGYRNVHLRHGDGYQGWKEHAPYDCIVVSAAAGHVPQPLLEQLAVGGRLVIPIGKWYQNLELIEREADGSFRRLKVAPVAFVPMTGEAQEDQP